MRRYLIETKISKGEYAKYPFPGPRTRGYGIGSNSKSLGQRKGSGENGLVSIGKRQQFSRFSLSFICIYILYTCIYVYIHTVLVFALLHLKSVYEKAR